jgi:1,2-diacylglycerol-3-alpha-glucose alpha-1,2-glucosyltransferase
MITIAMLTELESFSKYIPFQNPGGMGTIVPLWIRELEKLGCRVNLDDTESDFDILHLHNPFPKSIGAALKTRIIGKPVVVHGHHLPELVKGGFKGGAIIYPLNKLYSRFFFSLGDVIIAPSPFAATSLQSLGIKKPFKVIFNGVDRSRFKKDLLVGKAFREKFGLPDDAFIVLSVGLRIPRKGVDTFIETAAEYRKLHPSSKVKFVWVGGTETLLVDAMPDGNLPDNVLFTGYVPLDLLLSSYSAANVFFLPTRAESYGNVILEAASVGLPIVLRDIPAFEGWLSDGKDCIKGRNAEDFAKAIESIWKDDALRSTLRTGSEKLAQAHDIVNTAKKLYEVYSALMEGVR